MNFAGSIAPSEAMFAESMEELALTEGLAKEPVEELITAALTGDRMDDSGSRHKTLLGKDFILRELVGRLHCCSVFWVSAT